MLETFELASFNMAYPLSKDPVKSARVEVELNDLFQKYGAVGLQECGSKRYNAIIRRLQAKGESVYTGRRRFSKATTMVWDPDRYDDVKVQTKRLTPGLNIPLGAGPDFVKPKYANTVTFRINGRTVHWINIHGLASIRVRARRPWARRFFRNLARYTDTLNGLVIISGDFNTQFDKPWLAPLRARGFESMQQTFGPFKTHGHGVLDDVIWRAAPKRMWPVHFEALDSVSDHQVLTGRFMLTPRIKRR